MPKLNLLLFLSFITVQSMGQGKLTYEGPYEQGEATYEYTEGPMNQRMFNGKFTYNEMRDMPARDGEQEILITGNFKDDKKHLAWAVTIQSTEKGTGLTETVIGNYLNGEKSGLWTHRVRRNEDDSEMKFAQASFIKHHFRGPFKFSYDRPEAEGTKKMEIKGGFDDNGLLDGSWTISFVDGNGDAFEDILRYKHGVLAFRSFKNTTTGEVLESEDQEKLVTSFFAKMDRVDSFAVVGEQKYGLRSKRTDHRIISPVIDAWTDLKAVDLGLAYDASIPTMVMTKGERQNPKRMMCSAELIDWKETPQGKRALEEKMAIQKSYDQKINVADIQFNQGNYRQAMPLYKEALAIKKESYPKEQIDKCQVEIQKEEEKKRVITLVNSRLNLWKGNDKMLKDEAYYGKKKHLMEASLLALDYQKKEINSTYGELIAYLDRKAYDQFDIAQLESFQKVLDSAVAFQDKIKEVSKRDDTKDLEKTLKKMEDPKAIIKTIMGS